MGRWRQRLLLTVPLRPRGAWLFMTSFRQMLCSLLSFSQAYCCFLLEYSDQWFSRKAQKSYGVSINLSKSCITQATFLLSSTKDVVLPKRLGATRRYCWLCCHIMPHHRFEFSTQASLCILGTSRCQCYNHTACIFSWYWTLYMWHVKNACISSDQANKTAHSDHSEHTILHVISHKKKKSPYYLTIFHLESNKPLYFYNPGKIITAVFSQSCSAHGWFWYTDGKIV